MSGTVYVIVRKDMPLEHQLTQACHAAWESGLQSPIPSKDSQVCRLITLAARNELHLLYIAAELTSRRIQFSLFFESEVPDGSPFGYTAIATRRLPEPERLRLPEVHLWKP